MTNTPDHRIKSRLSNYDDEAETIEHLTDSFFPQLQERYGIPGDPHNGYLLHIEPYITNDSTDAFNFLEEYFKTVDTEKFIKYGPELESPEEMRKKGKKHVVPSPLEYKQGYRVNRRGDSMVNTTPHVSTPRPKMKKGRSKRKKKKTRKKKKKTKKRR